MAFDLEYALESVKPLLMVSDFQYALGSDSVCELAFVIRSDLVFVISYVSVSAMLFVMESGSQCGLEFEKPYE